MSTPIRVLIIDDSALMRKLITTMLEQDPAISVIGQAANGREAIARVQELRPDVVTMDVRMPVMDGLATTEHLMAYSPTPILVLTASLVSHEVDITFKMLGAGALEVVEKPSASDGRSLERAGRDLIRRVKVLSRVKVVTHLRGRRKPSEVDRPAPAPRPAAPPPAAPIRPAPPAGDVPAFPVVVVGASTGGPRAVHQILSSLPRGLDAAVVVIQHIAEGFSTGMVEWLAGVCPLPVTLAEDGRMIRPREVLVAPDKRDLLITPAGRARLSDSPLLIQRPSVDIAMQAAAEVYGPRAVGVLLTGMGRDGAYGMQAIRRCGGRTLAQDEATCAIYGMPRAAVELGAVEEVLPLPRIAARIAEMVSAYYTAAL